MRIRSSLVYLFRSLILYIRFVKFFRTPRGIVFRRVLYARMYTVNKYRAQNCKVTFFFFFFIYTISSIHTALRYIIIQYVYYKIWYWLGPNKKYNWSPKRSLQRSMMIWLPIMICSYVLPIHSSCFFFFLMALCVRKIEKQCEIVRAGGVRVRRLRSGHLGRHS